MKKVDVNVIYYGKPYQTIISILSLLKVSGQYINSVYITVEDKQPFGHYGDVFKVIKAIEPVIPIHLYYPKSFYNLEILDYDRVKNDAEYRWTVPYQYALEHAQMKWLFIMHNDMVFHKDMIGDMLPLFEDENMAGTGSIGQCWSCPAAKAKLCGGNAFMKYIPSAEEAIALHEQYETPRQKRDLEILHSGRIHPLPECRLNEYACMINLETYRKTTLPLGTNGCFGGNWEFTADLGTGWFHQMVNQGHKFTHLSLEEYAKHSSFNPIGQGIMAYSNRENYVLSEKNALQYLKENYGTDASLDSKTAFDAGIRERKYRFRDFRRKIIPTAKNIVKSIIRR